MAYRFTNSDKYKDNWFIELSPNSKLLFYFLIDNVNTAGFWEESMILVTAFLGFTKDQYKEAKEGLLRGLIISDCGKIFYLKNFLKHQKNLPLNKYNNAHKSIIENFRNDVKSFTENTQHFVDIPCHHILKKDSIVTNEIEENLGAVLGLISPTGNGKGKGSGKGKGKKVNPSEKEITDYGIENGYNLPAKQIVNHYTNNGEFDEWINAHDKVVKRWKSTLTNNWFKDEYKIPVKEQIYSWVVGFTPDRGNIDKLNKAKAEYPNAIKDIKKWN